MKKLTSKLSSHSKGSSIIEEKDIFSELTLKEGTSLFLGKYSMNEAAAVLRKRGRLGVNNKGLMFKVEEKLLVF